MLILVIAILIVASVVGYIVYISSYREAVKLVVASRLSAEEAEVIRSAFLSSDIAKNTILLILRLRN